MSACRCISCALGYAYLVQLACRSVIPNISAWCRRCIPYSIPDSKHDHRTFDRTFNLCTVAGEHVLIWAATHAHSRSTTGCMRPQVWAWELLGSCLDALSTLSGAVGQLEDPASPHVPSAPTTPHTAAAAAHGWHQASPSGAASSLVLSDKGVLQLLFDLRLLREVLAGGRPLLRGNGNAGNARNVVSGGSGGGGGGGDALLDPQDPTALAMVSERRKAGVQLEQLLQVRCEVWFDVWCDVWCVVCCDLV